MTSPDPMDPGCAASVRDVDPVAGDGYPRRTVAASEVQRFKAVLGQHYWNSVVSQNCLCGSEITSAEQFQVHLAEALAALMPEATEVVGWGLQGVGADDVIECDSEGLARTYATMWPSMYTLVTRTRRTYSARVSEWAPADG